MTTQEASKRYGGEVADWRQLPYGAIAHKDVKIGPHCSILGPAMFRGGDFLGGVFRGGEFLGGLFLGGVFRGGDFLGGVFRGGEFLGGVFRGGEFLGGEFQGGVFRGGVFRGGMFRETPFQIGGLPWFVNISAPDELSIGCERHTFAEWNSDLDAIAAKHSVAADMLPRIRTVIALAQSFPGPKPKG